jgi:hypothetical protein
MTTVSQKYNLKMTTMSYLNYFFSKNIYVCEYQMYKAIKIRRISFAILFFLHGLYNLVLGACKHL